MLFNGRETFWQKDKRSSQKGQRKKDSSNNHTARLFLHHGQEGKSSLQKNARKENRD
jgi:hypothetical protein